MSRRSADGQRHQLWNFPPLQSLVPRGSLLLALVTDAVNLEGVTRGDVVMLAVGDPDVWIVPNAVTSKSPRCELPLLGGEYGDTAANPRLPS